MTAVALSLLVVGCKEKAAQADAAIASVPVDAVTVDTTSAQPSVHYPATILRDREANLSLRVGGVIVAIPVRIGERVESGQVVGRLDATPYMTARVRAEADVARMSRAARRNEELLPAGAVARSTRDDMVSSLSAAQAALENARYDEASSFARAPFSGVVLSRDVEVGETVSPGQRIARIADLSSPLLAKAALPQAVAAALRPGAAATLVVDGGGAPIPAHVRHVGAASDPRTATVEVELVLEGGQQIASGTVGSIVVTGLSNRTANAQRLPAEVLLDANDGWGHVFVVDPATSVARRTKVRIIGFDGDSLMVSGVPSEARVITAGAGFVADGQKVAVSAR